MSFQVGSVDVKNLLQNLVEDGWTREELINEFIDNSIDAGAKNVWIIQEDQTMMIVDDGTGMTNQQLQNYFEIASTASKNRQHKYSIGSKGMGGKISLFGLSNDQDELVLISQTLNPIRWVETTHHSKSGFINNVYAQNKRTVESEELSKHIFRDIINQPEQLNSSFTIFKFTLDSKYEDMFMKKNIPHIHFELGITYNSFIYSGLQIHLVVNSEKTSVIPIRDTLCKFGASINGIQDISLDKKFECVFNYSNNKIYYKDGKSTFEFVDFKYDQDNNRMVDIYASDSYTYLLKEPVQIDHIPESEQNIEFIYHSVFNADLQYIKDLLKQLINYEPIDNEIKKYFYGAHFIRNGKYVLEPALKKKDYRSGDFVLRKRSLTQGRVEFRTSDSEIDNLFGISVKKSQIQSVKINIYIKSLINYLENKIHNDISKEIEKITKKSGLKPSKNSLVNYKEEFTGIRVNEYIQCELDKRNNQVLTCNLKMMKKGDPEQFAKIKSDPTEYCLGIGLAYIESPSIKFLFEKKGKIKEYKGILQTLREIKSYE